MTAKFAVRNWRTMDDEKKLALIKEIAWIKSIPEDLKLWAKDRLLSNYLDDRMKDRLERLVSNINMKEVWETVTAAIYARLSIDPVREAMHKAADAMMQAGGVLPAGDVVSIAK